MAARGPVGVLGAGTMGAGIAQLAALAGRVTLMHDPVAEALARGRERVREDLGRGVQRGLWSAARAAAASERLRPAEALAELAECAVVIEAAPEDLALKRDLFAQLETVCAPDAVLASNTSSISIGAIAAGLRAPERVCGMHFFNPPPRMKLVEIVAGPQTGNAALATATELARAMEREPVRAADAPGFIVNRCNRPYSLEALRMLGEGVATHAQIDAALRERGGFRMGPFELLDLVGVDVNLAVARSFYEQRPVARWEPHPLQAEMVAAGKLGRKAGRGFYEYEDGARVDPPTPPLEPEAADEIRDRILACLVNEATLAVEERVASPDDIDRAMRLGLNHPRGPFEWRERLGARKVVEILDALAEELAQPERYGVADSLRGLTG